MEHVRFIYLYIMIHDNFPVEDDLTIFYWKKDTFSLLTTPYIRPQTLVSCGSHGETARYGNFALDIPLLEELRSSKAGTELSVSPKIIHGVLRFYEIYTVGHILM
jgi:hypothetical protein